MTGPDMMLFDVQELLHVQYYMMYVYTMFFEISHICSAYMYMSTCTDLQPLFLTATIFNCLQLLVSYVERAMRQRELNQTTDSLPV